MGQVAERLMLDLTVLAVGSSQEMGLVDLPFVRASRGGYVYCSVHAWNNYVITHEVRIVKKLPTN